VREEEEEEEELLLLRKKIRMRSSGWKRMTKGGKEVGRRRKVEVEVVVVVGRKLRISCSPGR